MMRMVAPPLALAEEGIIGRARSLNKKLLVVVAMHDSIRSCLALRLSVPTSADQDRRCHCVWPASAAPPARPPSEKLTLPSG